MAVLLNLDKTQIINKDTFALLVTVARTYNYVRITIVQREYSFGENTLHVIVPAGRIDRVKAPLAIGGCICGGDCFFDGYMDSVRGFYIDVLTSIV